MWKEKNMNKSEVYNQGFGILLNPTIENDEWTGDVEVNIAFSEDVLKDEDDEMIMMNVLQMMASSLELMETDEAVARKLAAIVERRLEEQNAAVAHGDNDLDNMRIAKAVDGDDNIIHLSFVKSVGSA